MNISFNGSFSVCFFQVNYLIMSVKIFYSIDTDVFFNFLRGLKFYLVSVRQSFTLELLHYLWFIIRICLYNLTCTVLHILIHTRNFFQSYCQKHGKINTKEKKSGQSTLLSNNKGMSDSDESEVRRRKRKDMSSEEKNQARAAK